MKLTGSFLICSALLLSLAAVGATDAVAQTTIPGGSLVTDTVWNLAGAPYTVTGLVYVEGTDGPDGVTTLTIDPGVEVRFTPGYSGILVVWVAQVYSLAPSTRRAAGYRLNCMRRRSR